MFKVSNFIAAPALFALAAVACSTEVGQSEGTGSSSQASTSCGAAYAQCGGQGFTGATCCVSGYTCQYQSQYYSQCVAGGSSSSSGGSSSSSGSGSSSGSSSSSSSGGGGSCPSSTNDDQQRAAATAAYAIMKSGASACTT